MTKYATPIKVCSLCGLPVTRVGKTYSHDKLAHSASLNTLLSTCLRLNVSVTHQVALKEIPSNG